jgi:hypothetical protein
LQAAAAACTLLLLLPPSPPILFAPDALFGHSHSLDTIASSAASVSGTSLAVLLASSLLLARTVCCTFGARLPAGAGAVLMLARALLL